MAETVDLFVPLAELDDPLGPRLERALGWARGQAGGLRVLRRSLDARKGRALGQRLRVLVARQGEALAPPRRARAAAARWPAGRAAPRVVVVGSGPAGSWAALRLAEAGVPVTIVEQGKPVQPRRHDLALLTRGQLAPELELLLRRGRGGDVLGRQALHAREGQGRHRRRDRDLVRFGAPDDIAVDARPHVGSNRLAARAAGAARAPGSAGRRVSFRSDRRRVARRARPRARGPPRGRRRAARRRRRAGGRSLGAAGLRVGRRGRHRARTQGVRDRRAHRAPAAADRRDPVRRAPPAIPSCRPRSTS